MQKNWGFCDLSVNNNLTTEKFNLFRKFGFNTIAINTLVKEESDEPKKKKRKGEIKEKKDFVPDPIVLPKEIINSDLNILQRVTIEFSDSSITHKINQSENYKKYDLVAVIPKNLQAFQYACSSLDIDIITFDPESKVPFKVSRKLYKQAVDRGIFFELMYGPAVKDSTARKNIISTAHNYYAVGKSKNIVITSNAENYLHIRGVYDVINLSFLFGFNSNESLETIRINARRLILKGEARRRGKFYIKVHVTDDNTHKENE